MTMWMRSPLVCIESGYGVIGLLRNSQPINKTVQGAALLSVLISIDKSFIPVSVTIISISYPREEQSDSFR